MDAFYASVEQRDNPDLRGKPVVVGGSPEERSVVCAASYEARKFGIRSATPMSRAIRLCPEVVRIPPHFSKYEKASNVIHGVFEEYTNRIEPVSLDEAYLDIGESTRDFHEAERIGREIKAKIKQRAQLNASVGIAPNKYVAKIASDYDKPDGFCIVPPNRVLEFITPLPVRLVPGVGEKTEERLRILKIETIGQLRSQSLTFLQQAFGIKHGELLFELARGIDASPVETDRMRKSLSQERTFSQDISDKECLKDILLALAKEVSELLYEEDLQGRNIGIKVRFNDFQITTRAVTIDHRTRDADEIGQASIQLLEKIDLKNRKIRLLGVRVAYFEPLPPQRTLSKRQDLQLRFW